MNLLNTVDLNKLHISDVYKTILEKFGLVFREKYKIRDIIKGVLESGHEIKSVFGYPFPQGVDILNEEFEQHQRFFGNVLFESDADRENFKKILEILDGEFVIDELEIAQPSQTTGEAFIVIRGLPTQIPNNTRRLDVMRVGVPY